ncbi:MAG: triose-phosphate isomerase [Euryarchaeota archaeon]|nr:triose-phosphate isomerase [Euryarchaeota archaeon]
MTDSRIPTVIVNFKAYSEVEGDRALHLARICHNVAEQTGISIAVCPPATAIAQIVSSTDVPVFAQHVDPHKPGAATGRLTAQLLHGAGAVGTLINHSERRLRLADIGVAVDRCHSNQLTTVVCTDTTATSAAAASLKPNAIAIEPPELIGGDISVTDAQPEIIENTVKAVQKIDDSIEVLCGAGIKTGRDVKRAVELGASGVLLASGVVKAADPAAVLTDLIQYL